MYDTRSTQLGTSQGATATTSTLGPSEGTLRARASKAVGRWLHLPGKTRDRGTGNVTDLQGPPSERTQTEKIRDLKSLARQYACDRGSCDDTWISYLEDLEDRDSDNLRLAQMLAM
jgi:hypothetical protein